MVIAVGLIKEIKSILTPFSTKYHDNKFNWKIGFYRIVIVFGDIISRIKSKEYIYSVFFAYDMQMKNWF